MGDSTQTSCAIFGLGQAGRSLERTLLENQLSVVSATDKTAEILFLCVPDDALSHLAKELATRDWLPPIVVHVSGVHGHDVLAPLAARSTIAKWHPIASLKGTHRIPPNTVIGISASSIAVEQQLFDLALQLQLKPVRLKSEQQALYHAAACLVAGGGVGLVHLGQQLMAAAGLAEEESRHALVQLLESACHALRNSPAPAALTGPIARGDLATVELHMRALAQTSVSEELRHVYGQMGMVMTKMANLPADKKEQISAALLPRQP